jgi:hypothetical protein
LIKPEKGFLKDWFRFVSASNDGIGHLQEDHLPAPKIELLSVVSGKDLATLRLSLESALRNSFNIIEKISVICPNKDIDLIRTALIGVDFPEVQVIDEDLVLQKSQRSKLKECFGDRYGWALQQFLTVQHVLDSSSAGVLTLNSDTIIVRKQLWLDNQGKQLLMRSQELHLPYYKLLKNFGLVLPLKKASHITHHMLMQPRILRAILNKIEVDDISQLIDRVIACADRKETSAICIEFELYAYGMINFFKNKFVYKKFSNLGLVRDDANLKLVSELIFEKNPEYNSVSLHSYS